GAGGGGEGRGGVAGGRVRGDPGFGRRRAERAPRERARFDRPDSPREAPPDPDFLPGGPPPRPPARRRARDGRGLLRGPSKDRDRSSRPPAAADDLLLDQLRPPADLPRGRDRRDGKAPGRDADLPQPVPQPRVARAADHALA